MSHTRSERDPLGSAFADLTADLEDVTSLAVQGQAGRTSPRSRRKIVRAIRQGLAKAGDILDRVDRMLDGQGGGR